MNEETQMRMFAVTQAVLALEDTATEDGDIVKLAKEIFEFVQGETK